MLVELPDAGNVRMLGNLLGDPQQDVRIGADVEAVFEPHDDAEPPFTLVQWKTVEVAAAAAYASARKIRHSPGTPRSLRAPYGLKRSPEPATRSLTVLETRTSLASAKARHPRTNVDGNAADIVANRLALAAMQTTTHFQPE